MKLKIEFDIMELDDEWVGVPVGDNAQKFQGVLRLNEEACAIVKLLQSDTT